MSDYEERVVNPLLDELRSLLLLKQPEDPFSTIIEFVRAKRSPLGMVELFTVLRAQASFISEDEDDDQITSPVSAGVLSPSHSPSNLQKYFERGARTSFSAPATDEILRKYGDHSSEANKTPDEISRVQALLSKSSLGKDRLPSELALIASSMTEVVLTCAGIDIPIDSDVILIEEGNIEKSYMQRRTVTLGPGDVIGDPYCPESTCLRTVSDRVVFLRISQDYLDYLTRRFAIDKRERYFQFLLSVPIFAPMEEEELAKVCDALKHEVIPAGTVFINQGEAGNKFYIIESGDCIATRSYVPGQVPTEVFRYKAGDYLGELSLLYNEPRAASVKAQTDVSLLSIDRKSFKRLLGPIQDILLRNSTRYNFERN